MYAFERHDVGLPGMPKNAALPTRANAVGLPGLTAMPLISGLFQSHTNQRQESELVVFITPRIVAARSGSSDSLDPGLKQLDRAGQLLQPHD